MNFKIIFTLLSSLFTFLNKKPKVQETIPVVKETKTNDDSFFISLGSKYFDNWIYGEPIEIDPKIKDTNSLYKFLEGFNKRMVERGTNDSAKLREKNNLLYELAILVRNVEGKSPSTTGEAIGQVLSRLRIIDGERFDREVLKIIPKEK